MSEPRDDENRIHIRGPDEEPEMQHAPDEQPEAPSQEGVGEPQQAGDTDETPETAEGPATLTDLQRQRDEFESKYLRAAADLQNYVRRAEQNLAVAREQQLMSVTRDLVTVLDHFDRALEVDPEKTSAEDLLRGVTSIRDELMRILERFGVERIDAEPGEEFDPNRHEAMMRQPSEDHETNHVTMQLQPGYALGSKTLRPVKVAVAQ